MGSWFRSKSSQRNYIDRTPQNIPMPIGDFDVVHKNRRVPRVIRFWHRNNRRVIVFVALVLMGIGSYAAVNRPVPEVYAYGGNIVVADHVLTPTSQGLYTGAATYLLRPSSATAVVGTAATYVSGTSVLGTCTMNEALPLSITETCRFSWNSMSVTSTDTLALDGSGLWTRTYSNGTVVEFAVPSEGAAVPAPFPFGLAV